MNALRLLLFALTALPFAWANVGAQVPHLVSYQGRVTAAFAVTTYWSNDGTSNDDGEPSKPGILTVTSGLFTVLRWTREHRHDQL